MSTLKADTITAASTNGDLNLSGNGTGNVNLATGTELNGTALTSTFIASGGSGDGSGLTDLNASNLGSGTVPDARFPATLPAASGVNLTALNATNLGSGTVPDARFPATLPAASGVNLTALNATNLGSGTVATARLGSGTASSSTFLRGDGSWAAAGGGGLASVLVFTASGTWTKPADIKLIRVQLVGSGASGNSQGQGAGAGGYSEKVIDVTSISSETVTVGATVAGNTAGQTTSFGSHCSAAGGELGSTSGGGYGGEATGGDINITGGGGSYSSVTNTSGMGGASYFGSGQPGRSTTMDSSENDRMAFGSGGLGVNNGYTQEGTGVGGIVIVYEYK